MTYLVLTAGLLVLSVQICCQQPTPIIIALKEEMNEYRRLAKNAVQVSMNMSLMMTEMTKAVFMKSDAIEIQANLLEEQVITQAQMISSKSVKATECVQNLKISNALKEMAARIQETDKCLHNEANKHAFLETLITKALNHHRSHVMEGRNAMEKCALSSEATFWTKCLARISQELKSIQNMTVVSLGKVAGETIKFRNNLTDRIRLCEALSSKSVTAVQSNIFKLERCHGLE